MSCSFSNRLFHRQGSRQPRCGAMCRGGAALVAGALLLSSFLLAAQNGSRPTEETGPGEYRIRVNSDLVLVSVTARDKRGNLVRDLKESDFTVLEDGKPQHLRSFDVEDVAQFAQGGPAQTEVQGAPQAQASVRLNDPGKAASARDRRLIVMMFDLINMEPDQLNRATRSAQDFVNKQMTGADLVAVVSLSNSMQVNQDFTSDHELLLNALRRLQGVEGEGLETGTTGTAEGQPDQGQAYTVDDTEYNIFNTDRRLQAIASLAKALQGIDQKKSVLYFCSGMDRDTGNENQSQLRAAINVAVKANVSIYPVDSRGLEAIVPGGSAQSASLRGQAGYSGQAILSAYDSNFQTQETLVTLASDTGGKAFLDSNDFSKAFARVQADTETYYVLGYRSSNPATDGRYRKITVRVNRPGLRLEYRRGYFGPRDFRHFSREDRDRQMEEEMNSELPNTDLPVYLSTQFFRPESENYFVLVSTVVPGSAIPAGSGDRASLDVLGVIRDQQSKVPVGNIQQTVKLVIPPQQTRERLPGTPENATGGRSKNAQYNSGFLLPSGKYHLKFVVRENQNGKLGSFETDFTVPDLRKAPLKMSSVVVASQRVASPQKKSQNPLVHDGSELIPNIAHVFASSQPMLFYYEVYEPAKAAKGESKDAIHVLTSLQFFRGKVKVYETAVVEAADLNRPERRAAAFALEVPASQLQPGWYTCQVNVIDDAGGQFAFPRLPVLVRAASTAPAAAEVKN
jgi:VWFA-related protein